MNEEVWKWNVNLAWELFTSGIYFYSSLTPNVKRYIIEHKDDTNIVESQINDVENGYCYRNGDRNGYFIYQDKLKIQI